MSITPNLVVFRRVGNLLEFRPAEGEFTPQESAYLFSELSYIRRDFSGMFGPGGSGRIASVPVPLVACREGCMHTAIGLYPRASDAVRRLGRPFTLVDETPTGPRPNAYKEDWGRIYSRIRAYDPEAADTRNMFRPAQEPILQAMAGSIGGVIDAAPAVGKSTLMALFCLLYLDAKTHIVVRGRDIMQRLYAECIKYFPGVGRVGDGYCGHGDRVTIVSADSLHRADNDADFVLCDECHGLLSAGYAEQLIRNYPLARRYGFSATLGERADNADMLAEALFGPTLVRLTYSRAVELGLVSPMRVLWVENKSGVVLDGASKVSRDEHAIWRNASRNRLIADVVATLPDDKQVLLLVDKVEHAVRLGAELPGVPLVYGDMSPRDLKRYQRAGLLPEDYSPLRRKDRSALREQFEARTLMRAIATDVWNTGVDFKTLDVVVRCDVRQGQVPAMQGSGRASRKSEGKQEGLVIDIRDTFHPTYRAIAAKKRQLYAGFGWKQEDFVFPQGVLS